GDPEAGLRETIEIAKGAHIPAEIFHVGMTIAHNPHFAQVVEQARAQGIDVTANAYPYTVGWTYVRQLIPVWAQEGNAAAITARLQNPEMRARVVKELQQHPGAYAKWTVSSANPAFDGHTFQQIADSRHESVEEAMVDFLVTQKAEGFQIGPADPSMDQTEAETFKYPWVDVGSDGIALPAGVHTRRQRDAIGADIDPGIFEGLRLGLVHAGIRRADLETFGLLRHQKIHHRLLDRLMAAVGDLLEGVAVELRIGGSDRPLGIGARLLAQFGHHTGAILGLLQPGGDGGGIAFLRPDRNQLTDIGPAHGIGIGIRGNVDALGTGLLDDLGKVGVVGHRHADMKNLGGNMRALGDRDGLAQSRFRVARPHMHRID